MDLPGGPYEILLERLRTSRAYRVLMTCSVLAALILLGAAAIGRVHWKHAFILAFLGACGWYFAALTPVTAKWIRATNEDPLWKRFARGIEIAGDLGLWITEVAFIAIAMRLVMR